MKDRFVMLVAEDDKLDLELLKRSLPQNGIKVDLQVTRDGEECISYLKGKGEFANRIEHPLPDVIVLDLKMPLLNGLQVLEWVHKQKEYAHIPTIMLSGSSLDKDVQEAYRLGANTFFTKPSGLENLQELMRRVVDYWTVSERPFAKTDPR